MSNEMMNVITTDVNVGMNEVVSVFVAKYETELFEKKEQLSKQIKLTKGKIDDLLKSIEDSIDRSKFESKVDVFNMVTKVENVTVKYDGDYYNKKPNIAVDVGMYKTVGENKERAVYTEHLTFPILKEDVDLNKSLKQEVEQLNGELVEVMGLIKSVSRKERQIRGKISEMKLEQSGFTGLLDNPEMLKLVQLN